MKKYIILGLMLVLAACSGTTAPTTAPTTAATDAPTDVAPTAEATTQTEATAQSVAIADTNVKWTCPDGFAGQTLSVYNWATYIGENTVADFEKLCGVKVNYDTFDNNEAMIARLRQGNPGYDVAFANGYAIDVLKRESLLEEIDASKIPNLKGLAEQWQNLSYDPTHQYTVPYLWGSTGALYNTTKVKDPITSWEQVFQYDGPVAWINDTRAMMGVALNLIGKSNNSTNPDDIAAAKQFLLENSKNVVTIASDDGQTLLERGEVDIAIEYSGDSYQLISTCGCETFAYAVPKEGTTLDIAFMFVPKDAPNKALAEVFMDYVSDPAVGAAIVNYTTYATPFQSVVDSGLVDEALLTDPAVFTAEEIMKVSFFAQDVAEAEQLYNDAWDEILIQVGQ